MDIVSAIVSMVRKSGVFLLVVAVLALIARVESPQEEPEPEKYPSMAKTARPKPRPQKSESDGWFKAHSWKRNG